jgi:hypothetical protein
MSCASNKSLTGGDGFANKGVKGGSYITNVADLAIPFGLILAQRAMSLVMEKNTKKKGVKAKTTAQKDKKNKQKKGGSSEACLLCNTTHQAGGTNQQVIEREYQRLASELRSLLDNA